MRPESSAGGWWLLEVRAQFRRETSCIFCELWRFISSWSDFGTFEIPEAVCRKLFANLCLFPLMLINLRTPPSDLVSCDRLGPMPMRSLRLPINFCIQQVWVVLSLSWWDWLTLIGVRLRGQYTSTQLSERKFPCRYSWCYTNQAGWEYSSINNDSFWVKNRFRHFLELKEISPATRDLGKETSWISRGLPLTEPTGILYRLRAKTKNKR